MVVYNGNMYGVVDKELQELIPIAQPQMPLPGSNFYDFQTDMSRLSYIRKDEKGMPARYYYDLSKKQIVKDAQVFDTNGGHTDYNYINDDIVYKWGDKIIIVYRTDGIEAGKVPTFLWRADSRYLKEHLFLKDNIIPTEIFENGYVVGYTFALIE